MTATEQPAAAHDWFADGPADGSCVFCPSERRTLPFHEHGLINVDVFDFTDDEPLRPIAVSVNDIDLSPDEAERFAAAVLRAAAAARALGERRR